VGAGVASRGQRGEVVRRPAGRELPWGPIARLWHRPSWLSHSGHRELLVAEAARLAEVLATKNPTAMISSPLQRAVATAEAIGAAAGVPASIDIRLNDRDYGTLTGERRDEVRRRFGSIDAAPRS
jgi:broad specificity phosphatase PhoE